MKYLIKKLAPKFLIKTYHFLMPFLGAIIYRFPSNKIFVVGIVGTKGKTSTCEIISAILEEAGYKTAISSSLRFKINKESEKNEFKMTMPGRFFLQKFLRRAVKEKSDYAILELTSEGAIQYRHKFINFDTLIFTNLAPEHIESHGSFEKYRDAKRIFFKALEKLSKKTLRLNSKRNLNKTIIANGDDPNVHYFLNFEVNEKIKYGLKDLDYYKIHKNGVDFGISGVNFESKLCGEFNLYNILAAINFAKSQNIALETIKSAIEKFTGIAGRMEEIDEGQDFKVIIDYAHTPDSLEKVYEAFQNSRKICVLGSAGGGRDKWKRPEMGKIAAKYCDQIILTNEDPYDENPDEIVKNVAEGIYTKNYEIIMDRREAIKKAINYAQIGDTVIITGKGAEPWMMLANGFKNPWDDREIAREKLKK